MVNKESTTILVIGSGTMGNGIAHSFAQHHFNVFLYDSNIEALTKGIHTISTNLERQIIKGIISESDKKTILAHITPIEDFKKAAESSHVAIEAVPESFEIKKSIFALLDAYCPPETILASNTSSISITQLAAVTQRPGNVIGMHFMNPVPVMKLVEVINGINTSKKTTERIVSLAECIEKIPVCTKDYPGFISNRILMPMINEAIYCLYEGIAGINEIDQIMKLGMSHPMGPLQLADYIGLDVCLNILRVLHEGFGNPKYAPCPLLVNMVQANRLGSKTKQGFYDWKDPKNISPAISLHSI
ncbi:MAG: 3-hydroxybutyryl-CoA dehydrogenase [Cytophagales bacterium]|nr:3-hydroxybutyryl-CoA dehydrogenase [Cytophaga sp.]